MRITEYPQIGKLDKNNIFLIDGPNGTKNINGEDFPFAVMNLTSAEMHRMIFRGKNLGDYLSSEQKARIQDGSFEDLWLGDYWEIDGVNWRIVDFNYWYNTGPFAFTNNHLVIMPDTVLYEARMNLEDTTEYGYVGSEMYTSNLNNAKTIINSIFGSAVLTHNEYLINNSYNGAPISGSWFESTVELPNEVMIYGSYILTPSTVPGSAPVDKSTNSKTQLALFSVAPKFANIREYYWLRDFATSNSFIYVTELGTPGHTNPDQLHGVRPVFAIG